MRTVLLCAALTLVLAPASSSADAPPTPVLEVSTAAVATGTAERAVRQPQSLPVVAAVDGAATVVVAAERIAPPPPPPVETVPPPPPPAVGLAGLPFAPEGLHGCEEMSFYRQQAGLPAVFDRIGWRESNCRQEDGVRTYCCYGYLQLYVTLFLKDGRMAPRAAACGVNGINDVNSDTPIDKQRHMCLANALYEVDGMSPWGT